MRSSSRFTKIVVTTGLVGVFLFLIFGGQIKKYLDDKLFDSTYQFFLITIVGGGVSLIYEAYRRERELRERQKEIQRDLRARLITAYNDTKKVRRLLRARAVRIDPDTKKEILIGEEYNKQLDILMNAQLFIEFATRVIRSEPRLFQVTPDNTKVSDLAEKLETAEEYLNLIIDEYERSYRLFTNNLSSKNLSELPKVHEFINTFSEAKEFREQFITPFHQALEIISKAIQI